MRRQQLPVALGASVGSRAFGNLGASRCQKGKRKQLISNDPQMMKEQIGKFWQTGLKAGISGICQKMTVGKRQTVLGHAGIFRT